LALKKKGEIFLKGLEFLIENKINNILYKILNNFPSKNCMWQVTEDEVYKEESDLHFVDFFEKSLYNNEDFIKSIKKECYLVFCNIQMYKNNSIITKIETVEDFYNSNCEMIILITDNIYVEIYSKEEKYLLVIKDNLKKIGIKKWKYKDISKRLSMFAHGD